MLWSGKELKISWVARFWNTRRRLYFKMAYALGGEEGREEGREEERYEIITNMLRNGMNIDMVARIVKMTAEQVMAIGKKAAVL